MNEIDLDGRVAIVSGGGSGLGLAIADRLLRSGAKVWIWGRNAERLDSAVRELESAGDITRRVVDITDHEAVAAAAQAVFDDHGRLDILVNNAGAGGEPFPAEEHPIELWQAMLDVNLSGTFYCCRAAIPLMLEHDYGRIVNVSSAAAKEGNPQQIGYTAAKAGVVGLTKTLGKELAQRGIVVNCVTPAAFDTEVFRDFVGRAPEAVAQRMLTTIPMGRVGLPAELAAMVAWLASEDCSFTTGSTFDLTGGRSAY